MLTKSLTRDSGHLKTLFATLPVVLLQPATFRDSKPLALRSGSCICDCKSLAIKDIGMRKWHRWLSLFFGVFMLFIAATGLLSHWAALWPENGAFVPEAQAHGEAEPATTAPEQSAAPAEPEFVCPEGWRCSPPRPTTGPRAWVGFFHHLHSGEEFGNAGVAISILSGFALLFFSLSGIWMYVRMWADRRRRGAKDRWFWK